MKLFVRICCFFLRREWKRMFQKISISSCLARMEAKAVHNIIDGSRHSRAEILSPLYFSSDTLTYDFLCVVVFCFALKVANIVDENMYSVYVSKSKENNHFLFVLILPTTRKANRNERSQVEKRKSEIHLKENLLSFCLLCILKHGNRSVHSYLK